jgi:hypothetical protein
VVALWDDTQIARRWLMICPLRKDGDGKPLEPTEFELNTIRNDPQRLAVIRRRLSDIYRRRFETSGPKCLFQFDFAASAGHRKMPTA